MLNCHRNYPPNCRSRWCATGTSERETYHERQLRFFSHDGKTYRWHRKLDV